MIIREFDTIFSSGEAFPRVSVVIPLYNYAHLICETLDTLKDQEFKEFALIIVNDKSTDNSLEVAQHWCQENSSYFQCIRLISNRENGGLSVARNTGISATTSEYIFFLDADNMIYPRCLGRLAEALDQSEAAFAFTMLEVFGGRRGVIGTRIFDIDLLAIENYIDAMAMIRRSALEEIGGYKVMKYGWEDYELWLRLAESGLCGIQVPELLGRYRSHGTSMSNTTTATNNEAVKRQIREMHPWVHVFGVPDFVPRGAASLWGKFVRYGSIINRLIRTRVHNRRELRHLLKHFYTTYRTRGARGLAGELRALEAAAVRGRKHLDVEQVRWLPHYAAKGKHTRVVLPIELRLESRPKIAVAFHIFNEPQLVDFSQRLQGLPEDADVYVSTQNETLRRSASKQLSEGRQARLTVQSAPYVRSGLEAVWTEFGKKLLAYDYLLIAHGDVAEAEGNSAVLERDALMHPRYWPGILAAFELDPALGVVFTSGLDQDADLVPENALKWTIAYCNLRIDPTTAASKPKGSMAWVRPAALRSILEAELTAEQFTSNQTSSEAILALSYIACENAGFNWLEVTSKPSAGTISDTGLVIRNMDDLSAALTL